MGAWGHGPFDNDDAGDWEAKLIDQGRLAIENALLSVNLRKPSDESICSMAIAACEVVAAGNGHPMKGFAAAAADAAEWVSDQQRPPPKQFVDRGLKAAAAIQTDSALADLWREAGDYASWRRSISGLIKRLEKPPKPVKAAAAKKSAKVKKKAAKSKKGDGAISLRKAKQIAKKKMGGLVYEINKKVAVHIKSADKLTNSDAEEMATLENVTSFEYSSSKKAPAKPKELESMILGWQTLQKITAHDTIGLAGLLCRAAPRLPGLKQLDLGGTDVSAADLRRLAESKSLEILNLGGTQVTSKSLETLSAIGSLRVVNLYRCERISIRQINQLLDEHGERIVFNYRPMPKQLGLKEATDEENESFAKHNKPISKLIFDDWWGTWVTLNDGHLGFGEILAMDRLQVLAEKCKASAVQIGLNNSPVRNEHAEGVRFIVSAWPDIRSLGIAKAETVDDTLADDLARMKKLISLSLQYINIGDKTAKEIAKLKSLVRLELLHTQVTKKSLASIAALPKLRWLTISPGGNITRSELLKIRKKLLKTCYVQIVG